MSPHRTSDHGSAATAVRPPRPASEFACLVPQLDRLSAMALGEPGRAPLRDRMILALLPVGERIAARYSSGSPWTREDLRQVASVGVINAVDRWDPVRADGADILAFLVPSVRGEILRWFRDRTWATRVPRRLKELSVLVRGVTGTLTHELGRAPRPSELARRLDLDVADVLEALRAEENHQAMTLDSPGPDPDGATVGERLGENDARLDGVDDTQTLDVLLAALPDRERRIVMLRFYGGYTQTQIAEDIGISQMHVSRLLSATLSGLRHALLDDPSGR